MISDQFCYTLINLPIESEIPTEQKLKEDLQSNDIKLKTSALKKVILMICNGEKMNNILMDVIRFVMPCQNHTIKKLLLLFWEVVPKYDANGKLAQEMILVCDAYRKDLQHPNEFIRGSTLRFLCKLKEPELLEPLMPSILQCLEHRHSYVRRNAVLAIFTIYKNFNFLIPDAPDKISAFLDQEQDASCKRNAFMMLLHASQETALDYLSTCLDQVHTFGDILQLIIVELIYKVCHSNPQERARFIRCVYNLLQSSSPSVRYEAAGTLITLTNAAAAIKAVASCYIDLILKESDNNVKLIVLDRLIALRDNHEKELQSLVMDVLRILGSSDLEVRKKTLKLCLDLMTNRTAEELITVLRKEMIKLCSNELGDSAVDEKMYRYYLVNTIYLACMRYPEMVPTVVPTLCELLTYEIDYQEFNGADEVCRFLRESIQKFPQYRSLVIDKLMEFYPNIRSPDVLRHTMWIMGEYCHTIEEIENFVNLIYQVLGALPLVEEEVKRLSGDANEESALMAADGGLAITKQAHSRVTADGTYATQTALTTVVTNKTSSKHGAGDNIAVKRPTLQAALFVPDFMPAVVLSVALVKVFGRLSEELRHQTQSGQKSRDEVARKENAFAAECMLIIASMINLANSDLLPHRVCPDLVDRMWFCLKALADRDISILSAMQKMCREKLIEMINSQEAERREIDKTGESIVQSTRVKTKIVQPDSPVHFSILANKTELNDLIDRFDLTMSQALGDTSVFGKDKSDIFSTSKLSKVTQLTGFSDPIYAEAYVHVNQYDIVLDIFVVNQTSDTLQNLTVELATLGDLKLVEKPTPLTMGPHDFTTIKANIKVSSSENGIIFGNIVYDVSGAGGECNCVVLNDIHIDILEYITPASCSRSHYRKMWNEFEWENKVTVNTKIKDLHTYLNHITKNTNMRCLTPPEALQGQCDYLCVTLYAKSIFGEHVLANICLEKPPGEDDPVTGHVRIRAKSQGMAVTMGEKISGAQKQMPVAVAVAVEAAA